VNPRLSFDLECGGGGPVAGADEAGRGCLAGPLVAAAVRFDYRSFRAGDFVALEALDDSKKLTRTARVGVYAAVVTRAASLAVVSCSPASIDGRGLHRCNLFALGRALALLGPVGGPAFVDGFPLRQCAVEHEALVGGDGRSAAVAAASIVAKVTRDRLMVALHAHYPAYGFDTHVGYSCPDHRQAILDHGVSALHRLSFASVAYQQLDLGLGRPTT
jgi:ribonuclease HII